MTLYHFLLSPEAWNMRVSINLTSYTLSKLVESSRILELFSVSAASPRVCHCTCKTFTPECSMPLVLYYTRCKLFILIWKYCLINKIPFSDLVGNMIIIMLYVNKAQWRTRCCNTATPWTNDSCWNETRSFQDDAFWYITGSYEQSWLGIVTKQDWIPFWKWERAVLMFKMYLRIHH